MGEIEKISESHGHQGTAAVLWSTWLEEEQVLSTFQFDKKQQVDKKWIWMWRKRQEKLRHPTQIQNIRWPAWQQSVIVMLRYWSKHNRLRGQTQIHLEEIIQIAIICHIHVYMSHREKAIKLHPHQPSYNSLRASVMFELVQNPIKCTNTIQ